MADSPLVTPDDLARALDGPEPPALLDVRWSLNGPPGFLEYRRGHLPGAVFVDLDSDLAGRAGDGRGRHPLPDALDFQAAMRSAGVSRQRAVVMYDGGGGLSAARAWWLLRYFGHGQVRLLDGGVPAWLAAGLSLTTAIPAVTPGDFDVRPGGMPVLDTTKVLDFAAEGVLLDARAVERYRGDAEPIDPVAGHIPGARSAPTAENLDAAGRMLSVAGLRMRFAGVGVRPDVAVAAYCGSGVTAAHEVLALEVAGIAAALYPGSWSEWVSDPSRPVATGPDDVESSAG